MSGFLTTRALVGADTASGAVAFAIIHSIDLKGLFIKSIENYST
jgi:hypothetical protein